MNVTRHLDDLQVVKAGPSLRERIERRVALRHRYAVVSRLRLFREELEREMGEQDWTSLEGPALLFLADLCASLGLSDQERAEVLGSQGVRALAETLEARFTLLV